MYLPAHFRIDDLDECLDIVHRRAAGTLVVAGTDGFEATMLPWLVERGPIGTARLCGHVSRANPLVALLAEPSEALVVVDLVDGYVSPNWLPSKDEHHRVVPTWNYVSVHLHGTVRAVDDPDWLLDLVGRLTERHEAEMPVPWSVADAPREYIAGAVRGIVGLEVAIRRVEGKAKLSQNRSDADRAGVIDGLALRPGAVALAAEMVQRSMVEKEGP